MPIVNVRELARRTSKVISMVSSGRRPTLVTRGGKPIAALVPVRPDELEDWILANAPDFLTSMAQSDRELLAGRTTSLNEYLRTRAREVRGASTMASARAHAARPGRAAARRVTARKKKRT